MKLIDADALLEYLDLMYDKQGDWREPYNVGVLGAINYIKHKAPTIDAVSVVRCKECVHCADDYIDVGMGTMPQFTCELGRCGESVQPNDFCSYGERSRR